MKYHQAVTILGLVVALLAVLYDPAAAGGGLCRAYNYCYVSCPDDQEEAEDRCVDEANQEVIENCDLAGADFECDHPNCGWFQDDRVFCVWQDDPNH